MPRKRHKPEEIVAKLRQVDVLVSQGQTSPRLIAKLRLCVRDGVAKAEHCRRGTLEPAFQVQ